MPDANITTVTLSSIAGIVSILPIIDVNALLGSFAGAVFFVVFAKDPSFTASLGYLFASWIAGYLVAAEVTVRALPITSGVAALAGSVMFVILATGLLEWMKGGKAPFWLRYIPGLRGKRDD